MSDTNSADAEHVNIEHQIGKLLTSSQPNKQQVKGNELSEAETIAIEAVTHVRSLENRATLAEDEARRWSAHSQKLESEIERMEKEAAELKRERDFHMRHATELSTRIADCINILEAARRVEVKS